jgi:hypothetical protein
MSILLDGKIIPMKNSDIKKNLLMCNDDRDVISMTIFWTENNGKRKIEYHKENLNNLVFYSDSKNLLRCFEKESLILMKEYKIYKHPITTDIIPVILFESFDSNFIRKEDTIEEYALKVFQEFTNISIFIDHVMFLSLSKDELIKFNYEFRDFYLQNFTNEQRNIISSKNILSKSNNDLHNDELVNIQKYLLDQINELLQCKNEEYKYMINYIIIGALGLVIPYIKEIYSDFAFSF